MISVIIDKKIEIMTVGRNIKYYQSLGYECGYRTKIMINQQDIMPNSNVKVDAICDYCGDEFVAARCDLNRGVVNKHACKKCAAKKAKEANLIKYGAASYSGTDECKKRVKDTCMKKYGADNPAKVKSIQEKITKTNQKKYGVDCVFQSEEIKNKIKETSFDKYGTSSPMQSETIKEKVQKTCLERYGCTSPLLSPKIQEKIHQSNIEKYGAPFVGLQNPVAREHFKTTMNNKYGAENPSQVQEMLDKSIARMKETNLERYGYEVASKNTEIKQKIRKAFAERNQDGSLIPASKNQLYLANLYKGQINFPIQYYFLDIYFPQDNIYCEYDGSGHDLSVTLGRISEKEFKQKEQIRYITLKSENLKLFRIIHNGDKLPPDDVLLWMKNIAYAFLLELHHNWITFDIDNQKILLKGLSMSYKY